MKFKELKVGARFVITSDNDIKATYTKINSEPHYNTRYRNQVFDTHGNTDVKEIR